MKSGRPQKSESEARAERLAEALRSNLKRRKQQIRGREAAEKAAHKGVAQSADNKE